MKIKSIIWLYIVSIGALYFFGSSAMVKYQPEKYLSLKALVLNNKEVKKNFVSCALERLRQPNGFNLLYAQKKDVSHARIKALSRAYYYYKWFDINQESYKKYYTDVKNEGVDKTACPLAFYKQLKTWGHIPQGHIFDDEALRLLVPQLSLSSLYDTLPHEQKGARDKIFKNTESMRFFFYVTHVTRNQLTLVNDIQFKIRHLAFFNNKIAVIAQNPNVGIVYDLIDTDNRITFEIPPLQTLFLCNKAPIKNNSYIHHIDGHLSEKPPLFIFNKKGDLCYVTELVCPYGNKTIGWIITSDNNYKSANNIHLFCEGDSAIPSGLKTLFNRKQVLDVINDKLQGTIIQSSKKDVIISNKKLHENFLYYYHTDVNRIAYNKNGQIGSPYTITQIYYRTLFAWCKNYVFNLCPSDKSIEIKSHTNAYCTYRMILEKSLADNNIELMKVDKNTGALLFVENNRIHLFRFACNWQQKCFNDPSLMHLIIGQYAYNPQNTVSLSK